MIIKYAYLVFNLPFPFPDLKESFNFDEKTVLKTTTVLNEIRGEDTEHWREWLGSMNWGRLTSPQCILSTWVEAKNPTILDQQNITLEEHLAIIFRSLKLVGPLRPPDDAYLFSGQGVLEKGTPKASDIRSFTEIKTWSTAMFYTQWDEISPWVESKYFNLNTLDTWKSCADHLLNLFANASEYRQILESHRSFEEALSGTQLEFKIPNLVRALECLIHCWGKDQFATRTSSLLKSLEDTLPFAISTNTDDLLRDLYQLRNDCSHGKVFAYSLEKKIGHPPQERMIAMYEFLAEWTAREILNSSFMNTTIKANSSSRDALEGAWDNGLILPT